MTLSVPTVHMNGTSRDALLQGLCDAASAVRAAQEAMISAAPYARDYYPQGDGAYAKAHAEHRTRLGKLAEVCRELEAIANAIV